MTGIFITSTGTDTGKTFVACAMLYQMHKQGMRVHAIKPIASGVTAATIQSSDPARLLRAMSMPQHLSAIQSICPWRYEAALAPHLAARKEGKMPPWREVVTFCEQQLARHPFTIIEGAGGVMSPLDDTHTNLDLMRALNIPVLLVMGNYLGAISHALTALEVLAANQLTLAGIVISESEETSVEEMEMRRILKNSMKTPAPIVWVSRHHDATDGYRSSTHLEALWQ